MVGVLNRIIITILQTVAFSIFVIQRSKIGEQKFNYKGRRRTASWHMGLKELKYSESYLKCKSDKS
jgi:hypothetical protein